MSRNQRFGLVGLAVAVAVVGLVIANGQSSQNVTTSSGAHVYVVNAKPRGGIANLVFKKGGEVQFAVTSDVADEIHVHGYDLHKTIAKGATVSFSFPAATDGIFVVELEHRNVQIASLAVQP